MKDRKLILVSNDDGVDAKGLKHLVEIAKKFGDVFVAAPEREQSGKSHSINLGEPLRVRRIERDDGVKFFAIKENKQAK